MSTLRHVKSQVKHYKCWKDAEQKLKGPSTRLFIKKRKGNYSQISNHTSMRKTEEKNLLSSHPTLNLGCCCSMIIVFWYDSNMNYTQRKRKKEEN